MRKHMALYLALLTLVSGCASVKTGTVKAPVEREVRRLLSQMTLEEKVGQMTQLTLEVVAGQSKDGWLALDPNKLREAVVERHVGSILNCGGQARTPENWHEIITAIQDVATKETRLNIPVIYGIDAVHGANYTLGATIFPQNIAMAATGNVQLAEASGAIAALEMRGSGIPWNFAPVLGLAREPMWPRVFAIATCCSSLISGPRK